MPLELDHHILKMLKQNFYIFAFLSFVVRDNIACVIQAMCQAHSLVSSANVIAGPLSIIHQWS